MKALLADELDDAPGEAVTISELAEEFELNEFLVMAGSSVAISVAGIILAVLMYRAKVIDPAAIAQKIENLIAYPERWSQMGMAGRQKVLENYEINHLSDELVMHSQQLLQKSPPAQQLVKQEISLGEHSQGVMLS